MSECMAWAKGPSLEEGDSGGSFTLPRRSSHKFDMLMMTLKLAKQEAYIMKALHHLRRRICQRVRKVTLGTNEGPALPDPRLCLVLVESFHYLTNGKGKNMNNLPGGKSSSYGSDNAQQRQIPNFAENTNALWSLY
jgi:hypothetical protein